MFSRRHSYKRLSLKKGINFFRNVISVRDDARRERG
jgi:hypothetical protein